MYRTVVEHTMRSIVVKQMELAQVGAVSNNKTRAPPWKSLFRLLDWFCHLHRARENTDIHLAHHR